MLDATYKKTAKEAPDHDGPTGRLKFGTESNGGFKNITISNVVFDHCRGWHWKQWTGAARRHNDHEHHNARCPERTDLSASRRPDARTKRRSRGALRRISISNVVIYNADPRYASIIAGTPGHDIEDVRLSNIKNLLSGWRHKGAGRP